MQNNIAINQSHVIARAVLAFVLQQCILIYNAKASAGFFFLLQRRQKASTTLGIVREYNTCIAQPPIMNTQAALLTWFDNKILMLPYNKILMLIVTFYVVLPQPK
jgi:hypothetical protein